MIDDGKTHTAKTIAALLRYKREISSTTIVEKR